MRDNWPGGGGWEAHPMEGPGRGGQPMTENQKAGCAFVFFGAPIIIALIALFVALGSRS